MEQGAPSKLFSPIGDVTAAGFAAGMAAVGPVVITLTLTDRRRYGLACFFRDRVDAESPEAKRMVVQAVHELGLLPWMERANPGARVGYLEVPSDNAEDVEISRATAEVVVFHVDRVRATADVLVVLVPIAEVLRGQLAAVAG